ncbi:hypothetical protein [Anaerobiospirillum sp. NML120449]|uniref:hypothetical protein n=1 Tax=Anaerobiospirillum sp. NML120449 TaxID=2932817 RepID=UPI001FF15C40|nr:hypothetical protein [Anaerobiospirillum sp. NML120449]MCK0525413.1 hypothetical protein [Anaerobiospirillum sp. NML120449]
MQISKADYTWEEITARSPIINVHAGRNKFKIDLANTYFGITNDGCLMVKEYGIPIRGGAYLFAGDSLTLGTGDDLPGREFKFSLACLDKVLNRNNGELLIKDPLNPENGGYLELFKEYKHHNGAKDDWTPKFVNYLTRDIKQPNALNTNEVRAELEPAFNKLEKWLDHLNIKLDFTDNYSDPTIRLQFQPLNSRLDFGFNEYDGSNFVIPSPKYFKSENDFLRAGAIICAQVATRELFHGGGDPDAFKFMNELGFVKCKELTDSRNKWSSEAYTDRASNLVMASSAMMITAQLGVTLDKKDLSIFSNWDRKFVFDTRANRKNLQIKPFKPKDRILSVMERLISEKDYDTLIELSSRIPVYLKNIDLNKAISSSANRPGLWDQFCESWNTQARANRDTIAVQNSIDDKFRDLAKAITAKKSSAALDTPSSKAAKSVTMER